MKAVIVEGPGKVVVRETEAPKPGPYDCLVQMQAGCLCNSTDLKLAGGHFPGVKQYPIILGHEGVGRIVEVGAKVRSFKKGQRVIGALNLNPAEKKMHSGWGAFAEYALVGDHQAMVEDEAADSKHGWQEVFQIMQTVPDDISDENAVMLCTWREVAGGFSDFHLKKGGSMLVFGGGPVGQSFVKLGKLNGLGPIVMADKIDWKMKKAEEMGADFTISADNPKFIEAARKIVPGGFDFVLDAVGSPAIVNLGLKLVRPAGSVCVYGTVPADEITIDKTAGPYNWNLLVHQWPTREYESKAHALLCEIIRKKKIRADEFITHRYSIKEINQALERVRRGDTLKVFLDFDW